MFQNALKQRPAGKSVLLQPSSALAIGVLLVVQTEAVAANTVVEEPYKSFGSYSTVNPINGDATDIYFPTLENDATVDNLPVVLLLQGALVDKGFYSDYASQVARYGFAVAVPNHIQTVPGFGDVLAPETSQVQAVLDQLIGESEDATSPLNQKINPQKFGLLGHSLGGAVGLSAIGEICLPRLCSAPFERPEALIGGAFFGANLRDQNDTFLPIDNDDVGVALIQGEQDGVALPVNAERTFAQIQTPPKALITLGGVNHFGITNVNAVEGAIPDLNSQPLSQEESVGAIARWSGLFLRGTVLDDQAALDDVFNRGKDLEPVVTNVEGSPAQSVPEPVSISGVVGGLLSLILLRNRSAKKQDV